MKEEQDSIIEPFGALSKESVAYSVDRLGILDEHVSTMIRDHGVFLVAGSQYTDREQFLVELKQALVHKGCAVFRATRVFEDFSEYVYDCLQQQQHGHHSSKAMLPLKSDGANLFFDGNQVTVFIIDRLNLFSDQVIIEMMQAMTRANDEGHHVSVLLADEYFMNDRLEMLGYEEVIVSSSIIPALNSTIVRDYIDAQLSVTSDNGSSVGYSPGAINEITDIAKGDMKRVNELCRQSLLSAIQSGDKIVTAYMVQAGGSDRFFKLHEGEETGDQFGEGRILSKHVNAREASRGRLLFSKMRRHSFASTAALLPLILAGFYINSSIEERERVELIAQRSALNETDGSVDNKIVAKILGHITLAENASEELKVKLNQEVFNPANANFSNTVSSVSAPDVVGEDIVSPASALASAEKIKTLVGIEPAVSIPLSVLSQVTGNEDSPILLNVGLGAGHDGADRHVEIMGVPEGARLSQGTRHGDVWTVTSEQLHKLELTPSVDKDHDYQLTIQLKDSSQDLILAERIMNVQVDAVADKPIMSFSGAIGDQFTAIPIEIHARLADKDGSETLAIEMAGLPDTVKISAGKKNASGVWILSVLDLGGLILTPLEGSPSQLNLLIKAIASEKENSSRAVISGTMNISIIPGS